MNRSNSPIKTRLLRWLWDYFPWILAICLLMLVGLMSCSLLVKYKRIEEEKRNAIKEESSAVKVIAMVLEPRTIRDKINLPAEVEPFEDLWVKSEVSGQVVEIFVDEGQLIKSGQILVKLDDRDYISRASSIEANYRLTKLEYERISKLVEKKIAAVTDLDKVDTQLKVLRSQLNEANLALSRTEIKAPISGRLNEISAKFGDWMGVDKPVAQILQIDSLKVTVGIPESDVSAVMDIQEADIIIEALNNRAVKGKKIFLSRQPGTLARLYDLKLLVPNPDGRILPGMFARVELVKNVYDNALAVPLYAVITHQNEKYVYIEKNGVAVKRNVETGMLVEWEIQIRSGLEPGDRVIIVGHRVLDTGQKIDVIRQVTDPREIINL